MEDMNITEPTVEVAEVTKVPVKRGPKRGVRRVPPRKMVAKKPPKQVEEQADMSIEEEPIKKATSPWKPARVLDAPKIPGFTVKWWNKKDRPGNIDKRLSEGWEYVTQKDIKSKINRTIMDGGSAGVDAVVTMREMVLMKLPNELKEARNKYYSDRAMTPQKMATQLENDIREASGERDLSYMTIRGGG